MIETLVIAGLLVIYAIGCCATAVELTGQIREGASPAARDLTMRSPGAAILAHAVMIAFWPLFFAWHKVREGWR